MDRFYDAIKWESQLNEELKRLVQAHDFDFAAVSSELQKIIRKEDIRVKTSTRHRYKEFTQEACRLQYSELDVQETTGKQNDEEEEEKDVEVAKAPEDEDGEGVVGIVKNGTFLQLDASAEQALSALDFECAVSTSNQEGGPSISELGEVIRMLESDAGKHLPFKVPQVFEEIPSFLDVQPSKSSPREDEKKVQEFEPKTPRIATPPISSVKPEQTKMNASKNSRRIRKATQSKFSSDLNQSTAGESDDEDLDWTMMRSKMKIQSAQMQSSDTL
mmetsp:Transcript_11803/g.19233  ORF Transcript_11803/g.19233 Transcript_11803/m.19233 type:complete len:274 (+) Transcript_11803:76-897(+)